MTGNPTTNPPWPHAKNAWSTRRSPEPDHLLVDHASLRRESLAARAPPYGPAVAQGVHRQSPIHTSARGRLVGAPPLHSRQPRGRCNNYTLAPGDPRPFARYRPSIVRTSCNTKQGGS